MTHRRDSLPSLLAKLSAAFRAETPRLEHNVRLMDDGGAPDMRAAAKAYLALSGKSKGRDDWQAIACRTDADGRYLTPVRCAMYQLAEPRRHLVRDALGGAMDAAQLAILHGIPDWALHDVLYRSLHLLQGVYAEFRPYNPQDYSKPGWVSMSESQQNAVIAGEEIASAA